MFRKLFNPKLLSVYRKRESVLDKREEAFFFELMKQLPTGFYVFPKTRIADVIETTDGKGYYFHRNKILPKHIDFLICNAFFHPIMAIELNGTSHRREDRKESDHQKREILKSAGLPLEFVEVGREFSLEVKNLINKLAS